MANDPRAIIAKEDISLLQLIAIAITVGLNALDGFDVVSISFSAPGIAHDWGVAQSTLGIVLSMGLLGMALGSVLVAPVADVIGRRPMIVACLVAMGAGMLLSATANDVYMLSLWRVVTGLGIGAMLASLNAVAAEFSNDKRRDFSVAVMSIGYPIGVVVGGTIAAWLLTVHDWRAVFVFGGIITAVFIPLVLLFLPESISFLMQKHPPNALDRINAILQRMGHSTIDALPPAPAPADRGSPTDIFRGKLLPVTLVLAAVYFLHILTFYYMQTWLPKIIVDIGFTQAQGTGVLVWANLGGVFGGAVLGWLAYHYGLKPLTILVTLGTAVVVALFGQVTADLTTLKIVVFAAGFFWNAAIIGFYALAARGFPTHARASGTGFMIGVGRGGSVLAPILAGFLFQAGFGRELVSLLMALGSLASALVLLVGLRRTLGEKTAHLDPHAV
ncbi:MAG: MFS transporter [Sphingomonadales bacterium]